ncbi:hypothetical protein [Bacillus sp. 2205SS5-2]|uniref:hypothetical protein n=1 Tax=Bacillus sp. 2205SS5-2 TaxID=3109031 RepID=UPI0030068221
MTIQAKERNSPTALNKELQEEMVGVLTAISIVSKRQANRLDQLDEQNKKEGEQKNEKNQTNA